VGCLKGVGIVGAIFGGLLTLWVVNAALSGLDIGKGAFSTRTQSMLVNDLCPSARAKLPKSTLFFSDPMTGFNGFPGTDFGDDQDIVDIREGNGLSSVWIVSKSKDAGGKECAALELIDRSGVDGEPWYYRDYLPCVKDRSVCTPASLKVRKLQEKYAPWQVSSTSVPT
jgi:hypothetical protein